MTPSIYYFEKPTIGYCRKCEKIATYQDKLQCPKCKTTNLSIFEWNEESAYPE